MPLNFLYLKRLRKRADIANTAVQISAVGTIHWDFLSSTSTASPLACTLLGMSRQVEQPFTDIFWFLDKVHPEDIDRLLKHVESKLSNGMDTAIEEYRVDRGDGSYRKLRS